MEVVGGDGDGDDDGDGDGGGQAQDGDFVLVSGAIHPALQQLLRSGDPFDGSVRVQLADNGDLGKLRGWLDASGTRAGDTGGE